MDIQSNNEQSIKVIGEKQYDNNAYVTLGSKYSNEVLGGNLMSNTPIQITGSVFNTEGIYTFDIELRTIDDINNWVFNLSGFHSKINIEKDTIFEETFTENSQSFQTEDFLRKIFSNYKTVILFNEIFK